MTEIQIKNLIKEYEKEYIEFMEIEKLPQYKIDFFEINVEESDAAGFASAAQAYYNTKTDEHILRICKSSEIPRYIVFHEFTHILDTEMYAKQDSWKYMALSGYTEYHAAQVELMIMLGADSIQTQDFSFTVDVEIGNSTVRNYLNSRHQLVVNMMNRTDFPRDIEALKTTVGVLYNYFGVRSICKMYAKDYTEEVDNTIIIQKLSKVLFEEINSFMVGWFNEAQVELSFVSYMKIMWPMLQSYFGKEWKIVTVNTVLYTVKPSKINAWGELATFYVLKTTEGKLQPGDPSGKRYTSLTKSAIEKAVKADGPYLGSGREITNSSKNATPGKNQYKVALVIAPNSDYHWYVQNRDGYWSHKQGYLKVSNVDASGKKITDPQSCDRNYGSGLNYSTFCGYYLVKYTNRWWKDMLVYL